MPTRKPTSPGRNLPGLLAVLAVLAVSPALLQAQGNAAATPAAAAATGTTATAPALATWGYLAWWMPDAWRNLPLAQLDRLVFFELKANKSGQIDERKGWPEQWQPLRTALAKSGTRFELALTILDSPSFMALFQNPEAVKLLHSEALALAKGDGVHGLHLDFEIYEAIPPQQLQAARGFIVQLSQSLRQLKPARQLSVFYPLGTETALYDAATLAAADHVVLQGYDAHWISAPTAGPVAPLRGPEAGSWERTLTQVLALGMPRNRILFSFPLYGYEWPMKTLPPTDPLYGKPGAATSGKGVTVTFAPVAPELLPDVQTNAMARVQQYGASMEPQSSSSWYRYQRADGQAFEGWFEDWWSVARKTEFLQMEKLGGMAFFPLGYDQGELVEYWLRHKQKPLAAVPAAGAAPTSPAGAPATPTAAPTPGPVVTPAPTAIPAPATTRQP